MSRPAAGPRVAIFGLHLESNSFASATVEEDFVRLCWAEGDVIDEMARSVSVLPSELPGFYAQMDAIGPWRPVPLIVAVAPPGGPIEQSVFDKVFDIVHWRLRSALPVDAVYVASHGASAATGDDDSDGTLVAMARDIVGPDVPIVVTHDLHCNVSERLIAAADALIAYRTNPHVDMRERGAEAADLLHEMLGGMRTAKAFIRLPLVPPSVTLLTGTGPYADLVRKAESLMQPAAAGPVANVSVTGGFAHGDLPKCGMTINVTTRGRVETAWQTAVELARQAWAGRGRYVTQMLSVDEALARARQVGAPVILADVADNPGGGGRGNTAFLLSALHEARIPDAALGVFVDPDLAAEAHRLGEGQRFAAVFNRVESEFSKRFEAEAHVERLSDGRDVGRRGLLAGRKFELGPSALLRLRESGLRVVVGSLRRQLNEPRMLEMHGIDISRLRCLVVKSRGHFRAGFDEFFSSDRIFEVDAPGLTTPNYARLDFKRLPRPVWPLDKNADWHEPTEWRVMDETGRW